jgi:hypothetical protein
MVGGTAIGAGSAISEGITTQKAKDYEAAQLFQAAKAMQAKGTRASADQRRKGEIIQSNARAAMAGSGGVTSDAGAIEQLGEIKQATDYNALAAIYEAETKAQGLRARGKAALYEGKAAKKAGQRKALGTLLTGGGMVAGRY